jgi:hypothetical protein
VAAPSNEGYPCTQCGAPTSYKPSADGLSCDHCGSLAPIETSGAQIITYDLYGKTAFEAVAASNISSGAREVRCKTCGASWISSNRAERCAFCDSPIVDEAETAAAVIPPGGLLPFVLDRKAAAEKFAVWLRSRWFAPRDLAKRADREALDGVYLPYWTYDAETTTDYRGERGDYYYETEWYTENGEQKTREVRRTRWWPCSGTVGMSFDDVLVCGSQALPAKLVEKLEPWDLPELVSFDGRYLAGFLAERYRVDVHKGFEVAGARMEPDIRTAIRRDIGGDEQRIGGMTVNYDRVGFRHLLLPLWLTAFRYKDRVFHVTVNARTGDVAGERPYSALKIILLVLLIVAAIAAIVLFVRRH